MGVVGWVDGEKVEERGGYLNRVSAEAHLASVRLY